MEYKDPEELQRNTGVRSKEMWELDWKAEELGLIMKRNDELHSYR